MHEDRPMDETQEAGIRRALCREAQRRKARQGMRVSARPDGLHPVTVQRVQKLAGRRRTKNKKSRG
jgi:hypothetical protein